MGNDKTQGKTQDTEMIRQEVEFLTKTNQSILHLKHTNMHTTQGHNVPVLPTRVCDILDVYGCLCVCAAQNISGGRGPALARSQGPSVINNKESEPERMRHMGYG